MSIDRFYGDLKYYSLTQTETDQGFTRSYTTPVTFQGCISNKLGVQRALGGQLGEQTNYNMYCEPTVFPDDCVIVKGTKVYRIVTDDDSIKNTADDLNVTSNNEHQKILLETVDSETITLVG